MSYLDPAVLDRHLDSLSSVLDDEVVTHALSRDVALPGEAGTAVLISLDNGIDHTRPNTLGPAGLRELNTALDAARTRDDIVAIAITGKPYFLAAGADLTAVSKLTDRSQAEAMAQMGHGVYDKLHAAPGTDDVPTFCFINGLALGGGLEIALNCDYRTVSAAAPALGLPECFLGLVPGWGGAYLLPHLIGPEAAVRVIIDNALSQNRMLRPAEALELGVVDAMFDAADYLERSLDWMARVLTGEVDVARPAVARDETTWQRAVEAGRGFADQKVSGAAPAPYRALDLIEAARTSDRETAFRAEDEALTDLMMGEELRASIYAFNLVQKRARKPAGAPDKSLARPVTSVGVVGAGLMATQLALLFLRRLEVPVLISDLDQERVDRGLAGITSELEKLARKGRISPTQLNRYRGLISGTTDLAAFAGCDFVIEAVFEEMGVKQDVFAALEDHVSPECVLATNTSSLSITEMASKLRQPERVVGFHFFNPVAVLPLLEIVRGEQTDEATLATAFAAARTLRKNAVLVTDAPAFVVNRVLVRLMTEIDRMIDEGTPLDVADGALRPLGLPMSPLTLLQLVGPAIGLHVAETLHAAFGDRFHVSDNLRRLVEAGLPGHFETDATGAPRLSPAVVDLYETGSRPSTPDEVLRRVEDALAEEIGLMLDEGVVASALDIDLCTILGAGWPFHLGGITPYLDRAGVSERVLGRRFQPPGVATLPA